MLCIDPTCTPVATIGKGRWKGRGICRCIGRGIGTGITATPPLEWFWFRFRFWCRFHSNDKEDTDTESKPKREHVTCLRCAAGTGLLKDFIECNKTRHMSGLRSCANSETVMFSKIEVQQRKWVSSLGAFSSATKMSRHWNI